jgi:hypothetical protein
MNNINQLDSPDYSKRFLAKVVDNNDPLKKQRIKVTIPNLLEGDAANLPWLARISPTGLGYGPSYGSVMVPAVGSWVVVRFEEGKLEYGHFDGSTPMGSAFVSPLMTNYPFRYGFQDPVGNYFYVDTTPGSETASFVHKSGTILTIAANGAVTINTASNEQVTINGNLTAHVTGNAGVTVDGNFNMAVGGSMTTSAVSWTHTGPTNILGNTHITGATTVTGNIGATGSITDTTGSNSKSMKDTRDTYNTHTHNTPNQTI